MEKCVARPRTRPRPLLTQSVFVIAAYFLLYGTLATATRLRHPRQLDVRSQSQDEEVLTLNGNHNHKPVFFNCSNYAPTVREEEPRGTFVMQMHAEDEDPEEDGGTISYSFVTAPYERLKFEIDSKTGVITTFLPLDRDEPIREKEVYLTVLATDNGRLSMGDVCTFKVIVEDINDNAPVFDKVAYTESVPQDLPVGHEVMRVSASDMDDGNNSLIRYSLKAKREEDNTYFRIDQETGAIFLNKVIDRNPDYKFRMEATATDLGVYPKTQFNIIDLDIRVIESHKKAPAFLPRSPEPIKLKENFSDFDASIIRLKAVSNIDNSTDLDNSDLLFELIVGKTEQTNGQRTFRLEYGKDSKDVADIKLSTHLDYESNRVYSLIVVVRNKYQLAAETVVDIEVTDVNDIIPVFRDVKKGSVLENEPPGVPVMQVVAIDADGTSANNQVTYALDDFNDLFAIDSRTGNITTLVTFDREKKDSYNVRVIAMDNSPSALFKTGKPNKGQQVFHIEIADKNDNPPHFTQKVYTHSVYENANKRTFVSTVEAIDSDTASSVMYSIIAGNPNNSFSIDNTGKIRVNNDLDYEKITKYNLTVRAFDGVFNDTAQVEIFVKNINDDPPVFFDEDEFKEFKRNPVIDEETLVDHCITTVASYDPDIEDRTADQHIAYFILKEDQQPFITINKNGCMKLKKPLDRDLPNGYPFWNIIVLARDEDGSTTALQNSVTVNFTLRDINDNAPFLDIPYPVIWNENRKPGKIIELRARDYDSEENGPPFTFRIDDLADDIIKSNFRINGMDLYARVSFDREQRKSYDIPIAITDHGRPPMTGTSTLTVIIGDENDNSMQEGSSSIFI